MSNPSGGEMCVCGHDMLAHPDGARCCWKRCESFCIGFQPKPPTPSAEPTIWTNMEANSKAVAAMPEFAKGSPRNERAPSAVGETPSPLVQEEYTPFSARTAYFMESYRSGTLAAKDAEIARLKEELASTRSTLVKWDAQVEHLRGLLRRVLDRPKWNSSQKWYDEAHTFRAEIEEALR